MASLLARLESVLIPLLFRLDLLARHLPALRALHLPLARARLARAHARIAAILRALTEGTWRAPRPHTPRPGTPRPKSTRAPYLPRRCEFLLRVTADAEIITAASQLNALLRDPGTQHILAQAPATARAAIARALRGPARLLGLELPNLLLFPGPPRPPRPRKPRPPRAASRPQLLPTDLPIPKHVLAFARHNQRRFGKGA
jgi:hypothetical protein